MARGIKIKDVQPVSQIQGTELIPISNGSNQPATVTIETIKDFALDDIEADIEAIQEATSGCINSIEIDGSGDYIDFSNVIIIS